MITPINMCNKVALLSLAVFICLPGCGSDYGEAVQQQEAERQLAKEQLEKLNADHVSKLKRKYEAVSFPGDNLQNGFFSYDIQQFFLQNTEKTFVFLAYVEDVEIAQNKLVVEFKRSIDSSVLPFEVALVFRLKTTDDVAQKILSQPRPVRSFRFGVSRGDWVIVAKVENVEKAKHYQCTSTGLSEEEKGMMTDVAPMIIIEGVLVAAEPLRDTYEQMLLRDLSKMKDKSKPAWLR